MTSFADLFRQAWPDYVVDGVPASGIAQPNKATIRTLGQSLDATFDDLRQILALGGVTVYRTTRALLYADLAHAADTIAAVTLDVTAAYNGIYVKAGASGAGSWSQIFQFTDSASVLTSLTAYVDDEIAGEVTARDAAIVAAVTALDDDLTAALGGEATARADADTALDLRLDAAESTLGTVSAAVGARDAAITRVDDGLGILARNWRDQMSAAASGKAINTSGIEVTAVSYAATGYIDVTRTMSITRFGSPMTSGSFVPIAYYDAARALLGTAWTGGGLVTIFDMAESPDGTRYARLCGLSNVSAYIYEPAAVETLRDMTFSLYGVPSDSAGILSDRYVNKVTGAFANSGGSFKMTGALSVTASSYIALGGGLISPTDTTQCQIAFYSESGYLGYYNPMAIGQTVRIADHFPAATYVHVTFEGISTGAVYLINPGDGLDRVMDMVSTGAIVDYFAPALVEAKRLNLTGGTTQAGHEYWRTTDYIPVVEGQVFYYTGQWSSSLAACVAGYGAGGAWSGNLLQPAANEHFLNRRVVIPAGVATIRGCYRNDYSPFSLLSTRSAQVLQEGGGVDAVYLAPDAAYGRLSPDANTAAVHLFARGIVGDRAVTVGWAPGSGDFDRFAGDETLRIVKTVDGDATVKCRVTAGSGFVDLPEFPLRLIDPATVVSPGQAMNVIVIGTSFTSQLTAGDGDAVDGDGTWVNEFSRQLIGVGDQALSTNTALPAIDTGAEWGPVVAADIRAPLGLGNIYFRGTRGAGAVKHEGRGGWHPISYLQRTDVVGADGKSNAFWDPGGTPWGPLNSQMSLKYYVESNGFDDGTIVSGVNETGSNLLVILELVWNDVGNGTGAGPSATYVAMILDKFHEEYPDTDVWVLGVPAPPRHSFKGNPSSSVTKFYNPAEVFREAVRDFGLAYRAICADRSSYATFIQMSHQIDPEYAYSRATMTPNAVCNDPSLEIEGTGDHVHGRRRGYAMHGGVAADLFAWHYCRPSAP